jgi:hypothetical protein
MITVRNNQLHRRTITIDLPTNIAITLQNEQYDELISALELSMAEKVLECDNRVKNVEKKSETNREFIKEIREVFYEDLGSVFFKRSVKEIDIEKIDAILEKYSSLLGFE